MLSVVSAVSYSQWTQMTSPTSSSLIGVYFNNTSTGYITGLTNGIVFKTTNGGTNWSSQNTGTTGSFYDISFVDSLTGIVIGSQGRVIKTTNGGLNWDIKTSGSNTLYSILYTTALSYAGGGIPASFLKSTDVGNNWTNVTPPTTNTIKGVYFSTALIGWICGEYGTLWRTNDGGTSWIPQYLSSSYMIEDIRFNSLTNGFVCGSMGIMRSTNGGTNWVSVYSAAGTLYDMHMITSVNGWAAGASGKIVKTSNGGVNWYIQETPVTTSLYGIYMADANTGYAVGANGVLLKTTNGGGVPPPPYFQNISGGGITITTNASDRCAWGDFDNDSLLDLVVSTYNDACVTCTYPLLLFKNYGNGNFQKVTTGPIATVTSRTFGVSWGDYDNDGKLDLFVCSGFDVNNLLFHNIGGGNFTQVTSGSIVNDAGWSEACAWGDYDRDGWLDLFVANQSNQNNFLYHNNGNGTFTKITTGAIVTDGGWSRGCAWGDYDNDKWLDLFVVNYQGQNDFLYHNNGNGTFTRILTGPLVNDNAWGSGSTWGDYDNDGYLDLYVTNNSSNNNLYHNNGDGTFTTFTGGPSDEGGLSFGASWGDYNNDGYIDLFMTKQNAQNVLFKNNGGTSFTKVTNEPDLQVGTNSVANAWGDFNNDGKLDLFVTNNRIDAVNNLYQNIGPLGNRLTIKLKGCFTLWGNSNYNAIGARIVIRDGNTKIIREVSGGMGMGSQDMFWQHIGLGNITNVDTVTILWPSGNIQTLKNVASNQTIFIDECFVNVENPTATTPSKYELLQNYPNPFNPSTKIKYQIPKSAFVTLKIYDNLGHEIETLVNNEQQAGYYFVDFNGENLSSGIYYYRIQAGDFIDSKKMILIK